jgi:hypothetical protein
MDGKRPDLMFDSQADFILRYADRRLKREKQVSQDVAGQ